MAAFEDLVQSDRLERNRDEIVNAERREWRIILSADTNVDVVRRVLIISA